MESDSSSISPYIQHCQAVVVRCYENHEPDDLRYLMAQHDYSAIQAVIERLETDASNDTRNSLSIIAVSMGSFEKLEAFIQGREEQKLKTTVMWSLLGLLVQICKDEPQTAPRLSRALKAFHDQINLFNSYCRNDPSLHHLREAAIDLFVELIEFECNILHFLRNAPSFERVTEDDWQPYNSAFESTKKSIDHTLARVDKHDRLATHTDEVQRLQGFLSLSPTRPSNQVGLPFSNLPDSRSARFYDRNDIMQKIDDHFHLQPEEVRFRSVALHGLGGVGKSHIALKYAYKKTQDFSAIIWIKSETATSLAQSFSEAAVRLKLEGANPQKHEENRIMVLDWLQNTTCQWLLVYDNAEHFELLLKYWPVSNQGCALITTRNHTLAYEPAEVGIEVLPFDKESGSGFILHLLSRDIAADISSQELRSSLELSQKLHGHALAIAQIAGLIHRRSWSISEFVSIYDQNTRQMHGMPGTNSLDAVWRLSFESLTSNSANLLGIMSYVTPDAIPQSLFEFTDGGNLPPELQFCSHEISLSDVVDDLMTLALIKRDKSTMSFSLHRLVQQQFRYFSSSVANQKYFDNTTRLLFEAFPQSDAKKGQLYDRWTQCQLYLQHVLSLKNTFKESSTAPNPLQPSLKFCRLLKSVARFLLEAASYIEVEDSLAVARSAFHQLRPEERDQSLYSDLCASSGLTLAHRGLFSLARPWLEQSHRIRAEDTPLDRLELSWAEVNMGNLAGSTGDFQSQLQWHIKALRNRQMAGGNDPAEAKTQGVLYQNLGRSKYLTGDLEEARVWCHIAIRVLSDSQNWGMLAYTYFVLGNVNRAEGKLAEAQQDYTNAQEVWLEKGQRSTHHFNGACLYKLGCVAFDQGDIETATSRLRESIVIAQLHQEVLEGDYARVLYKLSVVLGGHGELGLGDGSKLKEAQIIVRARLEVLGGKYLIDDEETYDKLVYILWR